MGLNEENELTDNSGSHNGWHDAAGRFIKGNPGKRPGSKKNLLRDKVREFITENFDGMQDWFEGLTPREKFRVVCDLLPYCVSRLQSVSMTDSEGLDLEPQAKIDFTKLSEKTLKEILSHTTIENGN